VTVASKFDGPAFVMIWRLADGQRVAEFRAAHSVKDVAFSPSDESLALLSVRTTVQHNGIGQWEPRSEVHLWRWNEEKEPRALFGVDEILDRVAFASGGSEVQVFNGERVRSYRIGDRRQRRCVW
jgi:hypothetical protein